MVKRQIKKEDIIETAWSIKKSNIIDNINKVRDGQVDPEILEIMKEMLETAKIKVSMKDYFE